MTKTTLLIDFMRVFDCSMYDGNIEVLLSRLHALYDIVDAFIIVEATRTLLGKFQEPLLRTHWARVRAFAPKIRYVVLAGDIAGGDALERLSRQRNAFQRGLLDAVADDLICISSARTVPDAEFIRQLKDKLAAASQPIPVYADDVSPPREKARGEAIAGAPYVFIKRALLNYTPNELWNSVNGGLMESELQPNNAGCDNMLVGTARNGSCSPSFAAANMDEASNGAMPASQQPNQKQPPIIICPYVFDEDRGQVIQAFGLDQPWGQHLPFFLWKDENLVGPEHAFEHCWKQFPDRDVIIVHSDMRPMPNDHTNDWYRALCDHAAQLPQAGIIGCDLLFPVQSLSGHWYAQCAGGYFKNGQIGHYGGGINVHDGVVTPAAYEYDDRFSKVRPTAWATFGGVYIRREVIDMVGDFDRRYLWAYVMDVDYCMETRIRGQEIYQVPVNLLHEESKTSRKIAIEFVYVKKVQDNHAKFLQKWDWYLKGLD
jgi:Glycosyltransferase family 17